jgi:hypothetical protein
MQTIVRVVATNLPSAETMYPEFAGLDVAERVVFAHAGGHTPHDPEESCGALEDYLNGTPRGKLSKRPTQLTDTALAYARVEHGRWVAECPFCSKQTFAALPDPRFFCTECLNVEAGGEFVRLVVPTRDTRDQIELLLAVVPVESCRNWLPGETIAELGQQVLDFTSTLGAA